jgi:hypothetical protein
MYIPITTITLILMTVAMIGLRLVWSRIPPLAARFILYAAFALVLLHFFLLASKWETSSDRFNTLLSWLFIGSYELLILQLTRWRPLWLTAFSAATLILPLFSASILLPLTLLFQPEFSPMVPIGQSLWYQIVPWTNTGAGIGGGDIQVYYRPSAAPFLRHKFTSTPYNDAQCNFKAAFAEPGPRPGTVLARCPHWPSQPAGSVDEVLPLSTSPARLKRIP